MAGKKSKWGGARSGAGRPKVKGPRGLGRGRPRGVGIGGAGPRIHRIVAMLDDLDLASIQKLAKRNGLAVGTQAWKLIHSSLGRATAR